MRGSQVCGVELFYTPNADIQFLDVTNPHDMCKVAYQSLGYVGVGAYYKFLNQNNTKQAQQYFRGFVCFV